MQRLRTRDELEHERRRRRERAEGRPSRVDAVLISLAAAVVLAGTVGVAVVVALAVGVVLGIVLAFSARGPIPAPAEPATG